MQEKKLKKNDELIVTIERYGFSGEGIAVCDGIVIFVPFAMVGEEVLIHIINDKNNFLIAKIVKIITPSKSRVCAPCPYFEKCGGCDIQHFAYDDQLKLKQKMVEDNLKKYASIETTVNQTIASDMKLHYRNKFAFPVQEVDGKVKIGMYKKNSHEIIEIDDCLLQSAKTKQILYIFRGFLQKNNISVWNEKTKKGIVKHIVVRESGDEFILTVVVADEKFDGFEPLVSLLKQKFSNFGIYKNVNKLNNNVIFGNIDKHIYGLKELSKSEFGISYFINNRSFLQVNDFVKNEIYKKIIETIGSQNNIIDAYSGAGLLSAILAKNAKNVVGVEIIKEATENANLLKKLNNLNNLNNNNGDCAEIIPELARSFDGDFAVVVDPPRKGLDGKVVEAFLQSEPKRIVYLSCDPATLARDLKMLVEKYDINFVQPYDMFPQTANVETLVSLSLKQKTQNAKIIDKKSSKNKEKLKKLSQRSRYFDFYDDIKSGCHKIVDW